MVGCCRPKKCLDVDLPLGRINSSTLVGWKQVRVGLRLVIVYPGTFMVNTFPGPFVFQSLEMLKRLHKVAVNRLGKIGPEPGEPA